MNNMVFLFALTTQIAIDHFADRCGSVYAFKLAFAVLKTHKVIIRISSGWIAHNMIFLG
jgi:hypothetical protein